MILPVALRTTLRPLPFHSGVKPRFGALEEVSATDEINWSPPKPTTLEDIEDSFVRQFPPRPPGQRPMYEHAMREVLGSARLYESTKFHDGVLNTLKTAKQNGLFQGKTDVVLMNIDSHSDLKSVADCSTYFGFDFGSWVNGAILDHPEITEFIWVLPPEIDAACADWKGNIPRLDPDPKKTFKKGVAPYADESFIYVERTKRWMYYGREPEDLAEYPEKYDRITLRMITADKLPNLQGRPVFLSMDMDYFANSGHDTVGKTVVPYRGDETVHTLLDQLQRANVKPFAVHTAISPLYSYCLPKYDKQPHKPLQAALAQLEADIHRACGKPSLART